MKIEFVHEKNELDFYFLTYIKIYSKKIYVLKSEWELWKFWKQT